MVKIVEIMLVNYMLLAQAAIRQLKGEAKSECKIHVANQV